jgi:hypothetical protein
LSNDALSHVIGAFRGVRTSTEYNAAKRLMNRLDRDQQLAAVDAAIDAHFRIVRGAK